MPTLSRMLSVPIAVFGLSCIEDDVQKSDYPPLLQASIDNWQVFTFCNWERGGGPVAPKGLYNHDLCVCQDAPENPPCDGRNGAWADDALVRRYSEQPSCTAPPVDLHRACYWTPTQDGESESGGEGRCCYCARLFAECIPIPF